MSEKHDQVKYSGLKKIFDDCVKKILNYETRKLPADVLEKKERTKEYTKEMIESYNEFVSFVDRVYANVNEKSQTNLSKQKIKNIKSITCIGFNYGFTGTIRKNKIARRCT